MGKLKWYKRDPRAALTGMMGLTLEERGAYNTILDLIYARDGDLPDDETFIRRSLGCDLRIWRRIRQTLIDAEKIEIVDGIIHNSRATKEIAEAHSRGRPEAPKKPLRPNLGRTSGKLRPNLGDKFAGSLPDLFDEKAENKDLAEKEGPYVRARQPQPQPDEYIAEAIYRARAPIRGKGWPEIPDWIPVEPWNGFIEMRRAIRKAPTPRAVGMLIGKLDAFRAQGQDLAKVLDKATLKNWIDVYPIEENGNGGLQTHRGGGNGRGASTRDLAEAVASRKSQTG